MVAGIGAWIKRNYDRIIAAVFLLGLFVSLILLAIQAKVQKTERQDYDMQLRAMKPKFGKVLPADRTVFQKALVSLANPAQNEIWALSLLTPELRVKCVNCDRPIPYSATNCTFTQCGAVQPDVPNEIVDKNKNGIPDEWEEKYSLFSFDPEVINQDPDGDGFSSKEEYEWKTDPKDPTSHPPYLAKIWVAEIKPIPFRMVFKGVNKANGVLIFQINLRSGGKTYWKKMNEDAEGFKLVAYDANAPEGPTLTLQHNDKMIPLIKGHQVPRDDYEIKFTPLDRHEIMVRPDEDFEIKGSKYRVKKVDTQTYSVLVHDLSQNKEKWIGRQTRDSQPEAKP